MLIPRRLGRKLLCVSCLFSAIKQMYPWFQGRDGDLVGSSEEMLLDEMPAGVPACCAAMLQYGSGCRAEIDPAELEALLVAPVHPA